MSFSINPLVFQSMQIGTPATPAGMVPSNTPAQNTFLQDLATLLSQIISTLSNQPAQFSTTASRIVLGKVTVQWGTGTTGTPTTFGTAFSATVYVVNVTQTVSNTAQTYVSGISSTGFTTASTFGTPAFNYIAIGPT